MENTDSRLIPVQLTEPFDADDLIGEGLTCDIMYQWYSSVGQNCTNLPPGVNYGSMMRVVRCGTYLLQVVYNSTNVWYRRGATDSGFPQGWIQFANIDDNHFHGFFLYYDTADPEAPVSYQDTLLQAYNKIRAIIDAAQNDERAKGGIVQLYCNANSTRPFNTSLPNTESAIVTIRMSHSTERAVVEFQSIQSNTIKHARIYSGAITDWF